MSRRQTVHALRSRDDAHEFDAPGPPTLEDIHRRYRRSACSKHRVKNQANVHSRADREAAVVFHRLQRLLVTEETDVPHLGAGHHIPDSLHHPQPGAQDRDEANPLSQPVATGRSKWGHHHHLFRRQIGRGLVGDQNSDLPQQFAELLGVGALVSQKGHLMPHQRMGRNMHL